MCKGAVDVRGDADAKLRLDLRAEAPPPPAFLKYAPFGLSVSRSGERLKVAEVTRDESRWDERPAHVEDARWYLLDRLDPDARLVSATSVAPLDYRWTLGRTARLR